MKVAIASDHAGFELKQELISQLQKAGHHVFDLGPKNTDSVDYPDFAKLVSDQVVSNQVERGILICGTGIGMAISANKIPGIRAHSINSLFTVQLAREHNDLNVLCLGAREVASALAFEIVKKFLETAYAGGRHQNRLDKIKKLEQENA